MEECVMTEDNLINVFAAFEILLEEIETEIEILNEVGAEAMIKRDYESAREAIERASQVTAFREKIVLLRKDWEKFTATQTRAIVEEMLPSSAKRRNHGRLQRGLRTPEAAYYQPILKALSELGGSAKVSEVLEKVEQFMKKELKPVDYEPRRSGSEMPRWRNAAQWARNTMVEEGLLASNSPRGVWEITEAGRLSLTRNR